jgi:hypothetical protein
MSKQKHQILPINPVTGEIVAGYEVIKTKSKPIYNTIKHKSFIMIDKKAIELIKNDSSKHNYLLLIIIHFIDNKSNMLVYNNYAMSIDNMAILCNVSTRKIKYSIEYWNSQNIIKYYHKAYYVNPFYYQNGNLIYTDILDLFR